MKNLPFSSQTLIDVRLFLQKQKYIDYYRAHVLYYLAATITTSFLMYLFERGSISWLDCWFTTTSSMTVTGLSVIVYPSVSVATKILCFCLFCFGGQVAFGIIPIIFRRWIFIWKFRRDRDLRQTNKQRIVDLGRLLLGRLKIQTICTDMEHEELSTLKLLAFMLLVYGLVFSLLGFLSQFLYCTLRQSVKNMLEDRGLSPWSFSLFNAVSAFNNAGFSLLSDSLISFDKDPFILLSTTLMIGAGNTLLPLLFRLQLFLFRQYTVLGIIYWKEFQMLMNNSRHYTTHLFNHRQTMILTWVWVFITMFQWILYSAIPYVSYATEEENPMGNHNKILNMFFTTISTRTAGFNSVNLDILNVGVLSLQIMMMYIASYPFIVAVRSTAQVKLSIPFIRRAAPPMEDKDKVINSDNRKKSQSIKIFRQTRPTAMFGKNKMNRKNSFDTIINTGMVSSVSFDELKNEAKECSADTAAPSSAQNSTSPPNLTSAIGVSEDDFCAKNNQSDDPATFCISLDDKDDDVEINRLQTPQQAVLYRDMRCNENETDRMPRNESDNRLAVTSLTEAERAKQEAALFDSGERGLHLEDLGLSTIPTHKLQYGTAVGNHVKKALNKDILWLAFAFILISLVEPSLRIENMFRLLWECISAYGTIGTSLSTATSISSFCSAFQAPSKIILIIVMIAGRHRKMPHSLDSSVTPIHAPQS